MTIGGDGDEAVFTNPARPSSTARGASGGHGNNDNLLLSALRQNREGTLADALATPSSVPLQGHTPTPAAEDDTATSIPNRRDDEAIQLGVKGAVGSQDGQSDLGTGYGGRVELQAIEALICSYSAEECSALTGVLTLAGSTIARPVSAIARVLLVNDVSLGAGSPRLVLKEVSPLEINRDGDRFKVCWIDTWGIPAEMVEAHPFWDWAYGEFICKTLGRVASLLAVFLDAVPAVTPFVSVAQPQPASVIPARAVNLTPEASLITEAPAADIIPGGTGVAVSEPTGVVHLAPTASEVNSMAVCDGAAHNAPPEILSIIITYDWDCETALRIVYGPTAACPTGESNGDPNAISWAGSRGLFQLMPVHAWRFTARGWDYWTDWMDVEKNVAVAHDLWLEQGWIPWNCAP